MKIVWKLLKGNAKLGKTRVKNAKLLKNKAKLGKMRMIVAKYHETVTKTAKLCKNKEKLWNYIKTQTQTYCEIVWSRLSIHA